MLLLVFSCRALRNNIRSKWLVFSERYFFRQQGRIWKNSTCKQNSTFICHSRKNKKHKILNHEKGTIQNHRIILSESCLSILSNNFSFSTAVSLFDCSVEKILITVIAHYTYFVISRSCSVLLQSNSVPNNWHIWFTFSWHSANLNKVWLWFCISIADFSFLLGQARKQTKLYDHRLQQPDQHTNALKILF